MSKRIVTMNKPLTLGVSLTLILALSGRIVPLQAQSQEQIERFKKERETFFTERLELTPEESKAFWVVYDDLYNRKMKLAEDERNAFSYAHQNADNLSDKEVTEILDKIGKLKEEQVQLENDYYKNKFTQVLPPKKVLKLYQVDFDFRRYLLRRLREQQRTENGGDGRKTEGRGAEGPDHPGPPFEPCY